MVTDTYTKIARDMASLTYKVFEYELHFRMRQCSKLECARRKGKAHVLVDEIRLELSGLRRTSVISEKLEDLELLLDCF